MLDPLVSQLTRGHFYFWDQRALYIGPSLSVSLHAHHAMQVFIGLSDSLFLRTGPDVAWERYRGAVVRPDQSHESHPPVDLIATFWLEPSSAEARALTKRQGPEAIRRLDLEGLEGAIPAFCACGVKGYGSGRAAALMDEVITRLIAGARPEAPGDARIERARRILSAAPHRRLALADLARRVSLSASRLAHLFRAQVGIPPRRYLLWLRLRDAVALLAAGESVTEAAHGAGFADAAHLTRTFRRMLGFTPSAALAASRFVQDDGSRVG